MPTPRLLRTVLVLLFLASFLPAYTGTSFAQAPAAALSEPAPGSTLPLRPYVTVKSIQEFWNLPSEEKRRGCQLDLRVHVTYYDQAWGQLWVQDDSAGCYTVAGPRPLPFRMGQRLRVTGVTNAGEDLSFEHAVFEVLSEGGIAPLDASGRLDAAMFFANRVVNLEGIVDRSDVVGNDHLRLHASVDGRAVTVWVITTPGVVLPELHNTRVRMTGVYNPKLTPSGELNTLDLMVAGLKDIQQLCSLRDDPAFNITQVRIGELPQHPVNSRVRISGQVVAQEPGRFLRLRDLTGQIDVLCAQTLPCAINSTVEAVGFPSIQGTAWTLREAVYRHKELPDPAPAPGTYAIRLTAQVRELSPEEAQKGRRVTLRGVVTWSHPDSPFLFIQDSSGGLCIFRGSDTSKVRPPGRNVEVRGHTRMGDFAPVVEATQITRLGDLIMPEARSISIEHAMSGVEEAQWVEMRGYLRNIHSTNRWIELELAAPGGDFTALLPPGENIETLAGATLRLRGVCTAATDHRRQLRGLNLWVPSVTHIQVEVPAPTDPFDAPSRSIANLVRYSTTPNIGSRVKITGTVTYHLPGHFAFLFDEGDTILLLSRDTTPLAPGDQVEAVGFLGREGNQSALKEGLYRKTGTKAQPSPIHLDNALPPRPELNGHLLKVKGRLLDCSLPGRGTRFSIQTELGSFDALLDEPLDETARARWQVGAELALTGVYNLKYDEHREPSFFLLLLRDANDIVLLQNPPWLNRDRVLAIISGLLLCILLAVAWLTILRRRVAQQTRQIALQIKREAQLETELQRASKLESLGLLAGGIAHDFNNLLTVVMGNLSLSLLDEHIGRETSNYLQQAENAVARARDLTQQLLTFAKGGAPILSATALPDIIREGAGFSLHGSKVSCSYDIPADLWPANVDKGQISQVIHNIVLNAVQAMPAGGTLRIAMANEEVGKGSPLIPGRYVRINITDTGEGIHEEHLAKIFDPYFTTKKSGSGIGLATVYSIIRKHSGHVSVESTRGSGTTFHLWLPAAVHTSGPDQDKSSTGLPHLKGRVLVMDDEESIRLISTSILRRLGLEPVACPDGASTVKAYQDALTKKQPFDIVILDLTIPGSMGGMDTLSQLRHINPKVRAIVSSGYSNDPILSDYRAFGFVGMVSKPYEVNDLAHTVEQALNA